MTVGMALGSFDMFHVGHLRAVRAAERRVDELVLVVADDALVRSRRGTDPMVPVAERCEVLGAFFPDHRIEVVTTDRAADLVATYAPDVLFACGPEPDGSGRVSTAASAHDVAGNAPVVIVVDYEPTASVSLLGTLEPEILWSAR